MPIFNYHCIDCDHDWEAIVMPQQSAFPEPEECPECSSRQFVKAITAPALVSMDGKNVLRSLPDPTPPLQKYKEQGPKEGCEGGYADLPEFKPTERKKTKSGNTLWTEKKRQYFT